MRIALVFALTAGLAVSAAAQNPPGPPPEPSASQDAAAAPGSQAAEPTSPLRPYDRVVTKEAKTHDGVFKVHRIRERVLYEIPKTMLGREFLWVTQIARTTEGAGYGGQPVSDHVVRWERIGDRVLLRSVNYDIVSDQKL